MTLTLDFQGQYSIAIVSEGEGWVDALLDAQSACSWATVHCKYIGQAMGRCETVSVSNLLSHESAAHSLIEGLRGVDDPYTLCLLLPWREISQEFGYHGEGWYHVRTIIFISKVTIYINHMHKHHIKIHEEGCHQVNPDNGHICLTSIAKLESVYCVLWDSCQVIAITHFLGTCHIL